MPPHTIIVALTKPRFDYSPGIGMFTGIRARFANAVASFIHNPTHPGAPHGSTPTNPINASYTELFSWGNYPEITMKTIAQYRETDMKFQLAVVVNTAYAVGSGYHLTCDMDSHLGKKALKIAEDFCKQINLDELNQLIGLDVWASGNAFLEPVYENDRLVDVKMLPMTSIIRIGRDEHGTPTKYVQQWDGPQIDLDPSVILHFRWLPRDADAWGCGLGQPLAKPGVGYRTSSGKTVRRAPWFVVSEMLTDVAAKMTYAGLPRYDVTVETQDPEQVAKLASQYNNSDPLQHLIHSYESKVQTIGLETQSKFDSFIRKLDDDLLAGTLTPISRMWSSLNFTYASAESAIKAYLPLIDMYQRAHKRFVEEYILMPLLMAEFEDEQQVLEANIELVWGLREKLTIEQVSTVANILEKPQFKGLYEPSDVIDMLRDAGANLTAVDPKNVPEPEPVPPQLQPMDKNVEYDIKMERLRLLRMLVKQNEK